MANWNFWTWVIAKWSSNRKKVIDLLLLFVGMLSIYQKDFWTTWGLCVFYLYNICKNMFLCVYPLQVFIFVCPIVVGIPSFWTFAQR